MHQLWQILNILYQNYKTQYTTHIHQYNGISLLFCNLSEEIDLIESVNQVHDTFVCPTPSEVILVYNFSKVHFCIF